MNARSIIVGCGLAALVAAPVLAQRKYSPTYSPSSAVNITLPQNIQQMLAHINAFHLTTLSAECEVIQVSKTAWKPPYFNYRTGGIAFRMGGSGSANHYVAVYGTPPATVPAPNVPQPNRSETFASGKLTTGAMYDDPQNGIIIAIEADGTKQGNVVHVPVAGTGQGTLAPIYNGSQPTGFYRWKGTLPCTPGYI